MFLIYLAIYIIIGCILMLIVDKNSKHRIQECFEKAQNIFELAECCAELMICILICPVCVIVGVVNAFRTK